ncbi:MAG: hypothetical protein CFE29_15585 [Bradyrhizobiaceae bacterium PARB1]|nr:MAG: hypothetical protein CFE29_15585 [Bradyrhizobiaceae bacterium PARB1]
MPFEEFVADDAEIVRIPLADKRRLTILSVALAATIAVPANVSRVAIVTAALGAMTAAFIAGSLVLSPDQISLLPEAAQNIVAGDIKGAMQLLPALSRTMAAQGYFDAFRNLSRCLAALTTFAALVIFVLLGKAANPSAATEQAIAPAE